MIQAATAHFKIPTTGAGSRTIWRGKPFVGFRRHSGKPLE